VVGIRAAVGVALLLVSVSFVTALAQVAGPSQMDPCDQQTFTITLVNNSPTQAACDIIVTATPPGTGFSHVDGTAAVTLHDTPEPIAADPVANAWDIDAIVGDDYQLPPGEQISVAFDLATDCTAASGNIEVSIDYEDCTTAQPYQEIDSLSIEILPGALIVSKTPSVQDASVGEEVTWTLTVESSGLGTISNVVVTDELGSGLAYVSDTGGGSNVGQTTTWNLGTIAAGSSVAVDLTAEVIACSNLVNDADASWGCSSPASTCFDTAIDGGTATASLNLIVDNPALSFTAPNVTVAYCTDETGGLVQITNSGTGTARNVGLCCDVAHLQVDPTRLPLGATYSDGCFQLPDIAPDTTFDLTFYVLHSEVDWCNGPLPSGDNVFQLTYANDCGIPFLAYPQFSTLSSEPGPSLDVTKSSPAPLQLGEVASYDITVAYSGNLGCYGGSPGPVTIEDDYPDGFTVVDADGGTDNGDTLAWIYDPAADPPFDRTVQLRVPNDCASCVGLAGTIANTVTATTIDCCGCTLTGSATAQTTILCEGLEDIELFTSTFSPLVPSSPLVRCGPTDTFRVEHTYEFSNDTRLNDLFLDEFTYFVEGNGELQYAGSLAVSGASVDTVTDGTPAGQLEIRLADDGNPVTNRTITLAYDLTYVDLNAPEAPPCANDSASIDAGIDLDPGATTVGFCSRMYGDEADPPTMVVEAPAMAVSIDGIPTIQESCATCDIAITLTKTSDVANPHDVRLVLTNGSGSLIDLSGALCTGVSPTDGTTCTTPIEGTDTYEWRFADGFVAGSSTTIGPIRVTVPCGGTLADLSVVAWFDGLCQDDATDDSPDPAVAGYDDSCSANASDSASLSLMADVYTRKSPEVLYATTKYVTWFLVVHNTGNGAAYNVWVDDVLGSGLIFDEANTLPVGATVSANLDHAGAPINGASFLFDELAAGELKTITLAAELVDCENLTNDIAVSWGCGGSDCQAPRTDSSSVLVPGAQVVATSFSPTPIDVCTGSWANVTVKSAGIGTAYNIVANVTLPDGIAYAGNPRFSLDGRSTWLTTGISDPTQVGQVLTWTSTELSVLSELPPGEQVDIRFDIDGGCDFVGGNLTFQAGYENPCGNAFDSNVGSFSISARIPDVSVAMVQDPDDAIPCGGSATWTITVRNDGPVSAPYIRVVSTLDAGWDYVSSTGSGNNVGQITTWIINDLGPSASTDLTITADSASDGASCDALNHQVQSFWACDETDTQCLLSASDTASIIGARTPPVTVGAALAPDSVDVCTDTTTFTLTVANGSATAPASYVDARVTLPVGLSYVLGTTQIDCGSGFVSSPDPAVSGQQLTWYDTTVDGGANDACATLAANGQIQIRFDVDSSCYFTAGSANSRIFYYDCCGVTQTQQSRNDTIASDQPNLTITKSTADTPTCGETATWTIEVTNTSANAIAEVVRIEDFLGANLSYVSSTGGAVALSGGQILYATPPQYGAAYGWELGPLAPLASTSVTITAQLVAPADCANALRTNTAVTTWACGAPDGDPATADYDCSSDEWSSASDRVAMPNLSIAPSDITPAFSCSGDGIDPGAEIAIVVRNTGDAPIQAGDNFTLTVTETTTGYSATDSFTNLGGSLPLAAGGSDTLTFPWAVACTSCAYIIDITLDTLNDVCECDETDNAAVLNETITLPNLAVDAADLAITCAGDGQIRIQGPVTLRNDGCGDALTGTVRVRLRLFDGADCTGSELDTFTVDFTSLSIAAGGGTQQHTLDVTRTLDACGTCQISVRIEADDNDAVCECDGTNNDLCAGTFPIAFPDLTVFDIDFSQVGCASDEISGLVRVTVENTGCGTSGPFTLRLETDGCLSFADEAVASLAASGSTTVDFALTGSWTNCTDCSCTFTATVDPADAICECDGTNNDRSEPFTSTLPDLEISGATALIGCSVDGQATLDAGVTVTNTGCADVTGPFDIRVTIYEDANCSGAVVDTWNETLTDDVLASGSTVISLTTHVLSQALCAGDCDYSARFEVDTGDDICECDGTDNTFCLSSISSEVPDLVVTNVDPSVDCRAETANVTATVANVGCGNATGAVFRLTSAACGLSIDSDPIDVAAGASQDVVFDYTPDCGAWNCTYTVTADPGAAICECAGSNALTFDPYAGIGSIGDRVWFDSDGDGVQDPDEDGIPNVTLILEGDLDGDGSIDYTTEVPTDANGEYLFDNLPAGEYTITVDDTTLPGRLDQTYDADGLGTAHTSGYTLAENEHNREQDFGYRGSGSIGDYVWIDLNGDGVQDPSEKPIENVTVTLEGDVDGDGVDEILTTTTDADGLYLFDFLPAGPYTITVDDATLPPGLEQTYDNDGLGTPHASDYVLGSGVDNREQDFGYRGSGSIGDFVWFDLDGDGVQDPGEPGIENVTVTLVGDIDLDGIDDTLTTTTDADGLYLFEVLPAGPYTITVDDTTLPDGLTQTYDYDGLGTSHTSDYALGAGEHNREQDFGYATPALSVDKTIADILRNGSSVGSTGPVEPGDLIVYRFVIENVGFVPAYNVGFDDTLPPGTVVETAAPGDAGSYVVNAPSSSGSLGLSDEATSFTASIDATIDASATLTAEFTARVTSAVAQGTDLTNTAHAFGEREDGTPIPPENVVLGDTSDSDEEDPDADDTGIAAVAVLQPGLSVDKTIVDITRQGVSIGTTGPVQAGDVVLYRFVVRNVGGGTAYDIDFTDTLPAGLLTEIDPPGDTGSYTVTQPSASGSLGLADGIGTFTTSIAATIDGGESLTAEFTAIVTSSIEQGADLVNTAEATGVDGFGTEIQDENASIGDTSDDDAEDPDADDTGIAIIGTQQPALSVDKIISDILRGGSSIGASGPVEPGDVIVFEYTIRNVGLGIAYAVDFTDTLPTGLVTETDAPGDAGSYAVSGPAAAGSLAVPDAAGTFTTSIGATIAGGEQLVATYTVWVTSDIEQGVDLVNVAVTTGVDGAGTPIPAENVTLGDTSDDDAEDPDADDTGIAVVATREPALSIDKIITDILRNGSSIGASGPVEPGDIVLYQYTITNVGLGTAYAVDFTDTLPIGLITETDAPGDAGSYTVTAPAASGSLNLLDGVSSFTTGTGAVIAGGETLTANYTVVVTSDIEQGVDLINIATTSGTDGTGTPIPSENVALGDTSDGDAEDPDADDTGITSLGTTQPALSVDKIITDILRDGSSIGASGPVEPGDIIIFQYTIRNTGLATAYEVDFTDTLPPGLVTETDAPGVSGSYDISDPSVTGAPLLGLSDGATSFTTSIAATIGGAEQLVAVYSARVTSGIVQGVDLVNAARATGIDGYGTEIPAENAALGDTADDDVDDPDADDTGIAVIATIEPALSVDKIITDIVRRGASLGSITGPVEPGDVIVYQYTIRNVGLGTAYTVNFTDTLPTGIVTETDAPGGPGSYAVTSPAASGSLGLTDNTSTFTTSVGATIAGGEQLVAEYTVLVTSDVQQGIDLVNVAIASGVDGDGTPIPEENADVGDTSDADAEDPDADDTGIAVVTPVVPALTIDKQVVDILRGGASVGVVDPVLYGDVIVYRTTIRNVGLGTAYDVEFADTLPAGLAIETGAAPGAGSYVVTSPTASGSLGLSHGTTTFTTSMNATIAGGETLTATYAAIVTPAARPALDLVNVAETTGEDGAGTEIPDENADVGDTSDDDEEDPDADDTGIALIRVGAPALVTTKSVASIRRQGISIEGEIVEINDVVTYEVSITNVGNGPAYHVALFDELPLGFLYAGNSDATWPSGSSTADPFGIPGPLLSWPLDAALEAGEQLVLRFDASASGPITQTTYTNTVTAVGRDGADEEIPSDQSGTVPEDDDPDDSSDVSLTGGVPALVTDKAILNVRRNGRLLGSINTVEAGDVVLYRLRVANVGLGTAYDVDVRDLLPAPFDYVSSTTTGEWPFRTGAYDDDPSGAPGPTLLWDTSATLGHNESIVLTFEAAIAGSVQAGSTYINELHATGVDGAGESIPANNADDVAEDDDPDDRDRVAVTIVEEVPALVTTKRVIDVYRGGISTSDRMVEEDDVIRFELTVRNVGAATAYRVGLEDLLPFEFEYIPGSTRAAWPRGSSSIEPLPGAAGWTWRLNAALASGERLILAFDALAVGPLFDGNAYTNRMHAFGEDASGQPIPEDQSPGAPDDIDPDDASDVTLIARSAFLEGAGGLIAVPILRKRAEVLGDAVCEGWAATTDRLWFQTDIAMFAASELDGLNQDLWGPALRAETLLPTWLQTTRNEGASAARDNLLQTDLLSSIGFPLLEAPRIRQLATDRRTTAEMALRQRLDALADHAGIDVDQRPLDERWIFLEFAAGEPIYETLLADPLGPAGAWTIVDEQIIGSALGMGLLKQVLAMESLLASDQAIDRYVGWVILEIIANKLIAMDESLTVMENGASPYIPHAYRAGSKGFVIEDSASHLFDQLSLLWGLSSLIGALDEPTTAWRAEEPELRDLLHETSSRLIGEVLSAIISRHVAPSGEIIDVSSEADSASSTANLGLLVVALDTVRQTVPSEMARLEPLLHRAIEQLALRQSDDQLFASSEDRTPDFVELGAQFGGIRGLLAAYAATGATEHIESAKAAFAALDEQLWESEPGLGLYASSRFGDARAYCYTPFEVGLAVGALRELFFVAPEQQALIADRLGGFVRSIVDEAALQLSNVLSTGADITIGGGKHAILPLAIAEDADRLAPVLQQRLCLDEPDSEAACSGWWVSPHEPWYQTDISMYAAYVIQNRLPGWEDYADANLAAVVFHSDLGIPLGESTPFGLVAEDLGTLRVDPIALPYASGGPRIKEASSLEWDPSTFDTAIVTSAIGMTLLREAQEIRQILDEHAPTIERNAEARILAASILAKLNALESLRNAGPAGVDYVPHAARWETTAQRLIVTDPTSLLFDQAALVWGLGEAHALFADSRSTELIDEERRETLEIVEDLLASVLSTLEVAHVGLDTRILIDTTQPIDGVWHLGTTVSTENLGVIAAALESIIDQFGSSSDVGTKAVDLLQTITSFIRTNAWLGVGTYEETIDLGSGAGASSCQNETLSGQLGALRVLLAAHRYLGLETAAVTEAFHSIDARFWDPEMLVYRSHPGQIEWCATPFDLGMAIDAMDRVSGLLPPHEAFIAQERLRRHADRMLDAAGMQVRSRQADSGRFAPVFDRRVCFRPADLVGGIGWAKAGDIIRYTITVQNSTDEQFVDLLLADTLPETVTAISSDPPGEIAGDVISWPFDDLYSSETRTWQLLVRAREDSRFGDDLLNCAVLSFSDLSGNPQPSREACATTYVQDPDRERHALISNSSVWYETDSAMRLASLLADLACRETDAWDRAKTAREMAAANLGSLLGSSALGVPLQYAPFVSISTVRRDALSNLLDIYAIQAGLPHAPEHIMPIFLPYEGGLPVLAGASGFIEKSDLVTPAALGWTLVEEVQFVDACQGEISPLLSYLRDLVEYTVDNQVEWLSQMILSSRTDITYLPHGLRAPLTGDTLSFGVSDPRSTVYDQASLLLGLLRVSDSKMLGRRTRLLAQQLAVAVFDQLVLHWPSDSPLPLASLYDDVISDAVGWADVSVVSTALDSSMQMLPQRRDKAEELLRMLSQAAIERGRIPQTSAEAGRLTTLLVAARSSSDQAARTAFRDGWSAYALMHYGDGPAGVPVPRSRPDWALTPRELSTRITLLTEVIRSVPEERAAALRAMTEHVDQDILASHVQLTDPRGLWLVYSRSGCFGFASVFARIDGPVLFVP